MSEQQTIGWAVVEMFGHRRAAGYVTEATVAGAGFLRLDIPATDDHAPQTQLVNPASVYALHPVGEATARAAAARWRPEPVNRWELPALAAAQAPPFDRVDVDEPEPDCDDPWHFQPDEPADACPRCGDRAQVTDELVSSPDAWSSHPS